MVPSLHSMLQLVEMRSPAGNNGNLKNNWRKEVRNLTRFSFNNEPLAGYPTFVPAGGNDTEKVPRAWRFFRHDIRQIMKEVKENKKSFYQVSETLNEIETQFREAQALAALSVGTDYEDSANSQVVALNQTLAALTTFRDEANATLIESLAEAEEKKAFLKDIVQARYEQ